MSYTIFGKKILNEYIALGVYAAVGAGAYAATRGGSDKVAAKTAPEANSSSDDEAAFIRNFMNNLEREDAAAAKH